MYETDGYSMSMLVLSCLGPVEDMPGSEDAYYVECILTLDHNGVVEYLPKRFTLPPGWVKVL